MTDEVRARIGLGARLFYGIGALASGVKLNPVNAFLMLYYNQVVGLPAVTVSAVLMVSLICDAIFDPLIGQFSDNLRSKWGRRLPLMYAAALPLSAFFFLLWIPPPSWSDGALTAYLAVCLIGVRLFDTFFELPHQALVPELTADYDERTRLFTVRSLFETSGGVVMTVLAYNVFMKERPDGSGGLLSAEGYPAFAAVSAVVILFSILVCTGGLHRRVSKRLPPAKRKSLVTVAKEMAATLNSRAVLVLVAAAVFISIGAGLSGALSLYWVLYFYQFSQEQLSLLIAPTMIGIMAVAVTPSISARLGKRNAVIFLIWIHVPATVTPLLARLFSLAPAGSPQLLGLAILQSAIAPATIVMLLIIISSMIADLVEDAEVRTGRRSEGLLLSASNLVRKATAGFGTLAAGLILALVDFPVGSGRQDVPPSVLSEMAVVYLIAKVGIFAATTLCLLFCRADRNSHEENLRRILEGRRGETTLAVEPQAASAKDEAVRLSGGFASPRRGA